MGFEDEYNSFAQNLTDKGYGHITMPDFYKVITGNFNISRIMRLITRNVSEEVILDCPEDLDVQYGQIKVNLNYIYYSNIPPQANYTIVMSDEFSKTIARITYAVDFMGIPMLTIVPDFLHQDASGDMSKSSARLFMYVMIEIGKIFIKSIHEH